jgi:hypothetical protein
MNDSGDRPTVSLPICSGNSRTCLSDVGLLNWTLRLQSCESDVPGRIPLRYLFRRIYLVSVRVLRLERNRW